MKKKKTFITLIIILIIVMSLWISGMIPQQIAKIYGNNYMNKHFPEMQLKYVDIEWSKYHDDYIITFKDKDNNTHGCTIGPKYFPINLGQGIFEIEEIYRKQRNIPIEKNATEKEEVDTNTEINISEENNINAPPTTQELIDEFDKSAENLDSNYFVTDFETYKSKASNMKLNNKQISEIAEKGFEESAKRIAGEGASNKETEKIVLEEVIPNNYFTMKYRESDTNYPELKMNAYVVTRENEMGCGIIIYIDPTTALIVGGDAYGD